MKTKVSALFVSFFLLVVCERTEVERTFFGMPAEEASRTVLAWLAEDLADNSDEDVSIFSTTSDPKTTTQTPKPKPTTTTPLDISAVLKDILAASRKPAPASHRVPSPDFKFWDRMDNAVFNWFSTEKKGIYRPASADYLAAQ